MRKADKLENNARRLLQRPMEMSDFRILQSDADRLRKEATCIIDIAKTAWQATLFKSLSH